MLQGKRGSDIAKFKTEVFEASIRHGLSEDELIYAITSIVADAAERRVLSEPTQPEATDGEG